MVASGTRSAQLPLEGASRLGANVIAKHDGQHPRAKLLRDVIRKRARGRFHSDFSGRKWPLSRTRVTASSAIFCAICRFSGLPTRLEIAFTVHEPILVQTRAHALARSNFSTDSSMRCFRNLAAADGVEHAVVGGVEVAGNQHQIFTSLDGLDRRAPIGSRGDWVQGNSRTTAFMSIASVTTIPSKPMRCLSRPVMMAV